MFKVSLSRQDLGDFLDGDAAAMEQYRAELESRLSELGSADVEISDTLTDKLTIDGEHDDGTIANVMNNMVSDWSWLS